MTNERELLIAYEMWKNEKHYDNEKSLVDEIHDINNFLDTLPASPEPEQDKGEDEIMQALIKKHLEGWQPPFTSSIQYYLTSGKVTGSLWIAIKEVMKRYASHREIKVPGDCNCSMEGSPHRNEWAGRHCPICGKLVTLNDKK